VLGSPASSVASAWRNSEVKVSTEVIVAAEEVHRSLAPIKMVTYLACCWTAFAACAGASLILAPDTESL
jgi:hypothetical protein